MTIGCEILEGSAYAGAVGALGECGRGRSGRSRARKKHLKVGDDCLMGRAYLKVRGGKNKGERGRDPVEFQLGWFVAWASSVSRLFFC
jgi:hypothetical protein